MLRILKILAVTGLALLLLTGFLVFLGAQVPEPMTDASVEGLTNEAQIHWFDVGGRPPRIEAATVPDAFRALGFAQTQASPWQVLLWRQAAAGRLAEWYGPEALPADNTVRHLGLLRGAKAATTGLSPEDRRLLEAFVAGVNEGIASARVQNDAQVTLMGVRPERFDVADVLAIERLIAWLGTPLSPPSAAARWPDVATFRAGDTRLRALLNADGFGRSRLWTFADSTESRLVATFVTGAMARPLFFDAEVVVGGTTRVGVFLPGTPFALAGADASGRGRQITRAWAVYPVAEADWRTPGSDRPRRRAERLLIEGGQEAVQIVTTTTEGLLFRSPTRRPGLRPRLSLPILCAPPPTPPGLPGCSFSASGAPFVRHAPHRTSGGPTQRVRPPPRRWFSPGPGLTRAPMHRPGSRYGAVRRPISPFSRAKCFPPEPPQEEGVPTGEAW